MPTLANRAAQALAKLALEPEWEARFEPNSYGFRPGRSCHDAIGAIFRSISQQAKFVLDADIAKCFDRIDHEALLRKLATFPTLRRAIKGWLKAGVMDGEELFPTEEGTPQGGVISPILANVALHGLEEAVAKAFPRHTKAAVVYQRPMVLRYADDFVVLHRDLAVIEKVKQLASEWLAGMGLEMKPSKTAITHTLHQHEGRVGFDFLGFNVRQYPAGKNHSAKTGGRGGNPTILGFKTLIKPGKEAIHRHSVAIQQVVRSHQGVTQAALISHINPIIRGWSNYYSTVAAKATFAKLDNLTYAKLRRWAIGRHRNKSERWVARKYWRLETGKWDFATRDGKRLYNHVQTPIRRHVKVKGAKSPYDGDWVYWASRLGSHPELPKVVATLLKRQRGRCAHCGLYFQDGDLPELCSVRRTVLDGLRHQQVRLLVHRRCHDGKAAAPQAAAGGAREKSPTA